jgi:hypothetical protein
MKSILRTISYLFFVLVCAAIVFIGYLGFIPGIATIFGSDKPRDLNISYTSDDLKNSVEKIGTNLNSLPAGNTKVEDSVSYEGFRSINTSLSSQEITAYINNEKWKYFPVKDVQIKFNNDDSVEISGLIIKDRLENYIKATKVKDSEYSEIKKYLIVPVNTVPFYVKGNIEIVNNKVTLNSETLEIGKLTIDNAVINNNKTAFQQFIEDRINFIPNLKVTSGKINDGKLSLIGTVPEKELSAW